MTRTAPPPTQTRSGDEWQEPTVADLRAIEAEWPVLAAEVELVDAECRAATHPGPVSRRAVQRALRRLATANALTQKKGATGA
jgi:hypothetical protein